MPNKKDLCSKCKENLKGVYYSVCKSCSYRFRSEGKPPKKWKSGYLWIFSNGEYKPEHIAIAEKALGRKLKSGEIVHHINMKRDDNKNSNLLVCDKNYHIWLHQEYGRQFARSLEN